MVSVAVLALVVAAIGITNTMIMSVLERAHEIGIMKALGTPRSRRPAHLPGRRNADRVSWQRSGTGPWLAGFFPGQRDCPRVNNAQEELPLKGTLFIYPGWLVIGVPVLVCTITTLAALYPASRAARVDPITSLRHE